MVMGPDILAKVKIMDRLRTGPPAMPDRYSVMGLANTLQAYSEPTHSTIRQPAASKIQRFFSRVMGHPPLVPLLSF